MKKTSIGILFFLMVTSMSVSASALTITVTLGSASLPKGMKQQFKATGAFSPTVTKDLTSLVTWSSSDTSIAAMDGTTPGLVIGVSAGSTTITAKFGSNFGTANLTVTAPVKLESIDVKPKDSSLYLYYWVPTQFTAIGTYSDTKNRDITKEVIWKSSTPLVAGIDLESGLASPKAVGKTDISATLSGVTGKTSLTVTSELKIDLSGLSGIKPITIGEPKPPTPPTLKGVMLIDMPSVPCKKESGGDCYGGRGADDGRFMCPKGYVVTEYEMGMTAEGIERCHFSPNPLTGFQSCMEDAYAIDIAGTLKIVCSRLNPEGFNRAKTSEFAETSEGKEQAGTKGGKVLRDDCFLNEKDSTGVAVGLFGRSDDWLNSFGLLCGGYIKTDKGVAVTPYHLGKNETKSDGSYGGAPGTEGYPFDVRCPAGSVLVGIGIKSAYRVHGITGIYCAKPELDYGQPSTPQPLSRETKLPQTDIEKAQPATPDAARDLRVIPHIEPVPQLAPQEVPQRQSEEPSARPTSTPQRAPEEE